MQGIEAKSRGVLGLRLNIGERKLILGLVDVLALNSALIGVAGLRLSASWQVLLEHPLWFLLLTVLWVMFAATFDAYDLAAVCDVWASTKRAAQTLLFTWLAYLPIPYITPPLLRSRLALVLFLLFTCGFLMAGRVLYALMFCQPGLRRRALIIGAGWSGRTLLQALVDSRVPAYEIVGFVDDDPAMLGVAVTLPESGLHKSGAYSSSDLEHDHAGAKPSVEGTGRLRVLGDHRALPDLVLQHQVTTLVLAMPDGVTGELVRTVMDCLELGVEIIAMPVLYERLTGRVAIQHIGAHWCAAMPTGHPGTHALWHLMKRLTDVVLSCFGLAMLGLALPVIAAAIYLDSPGPIFYVQERVGQGGRRFQLYKFRSMVSGAESDRAIWASENDPRVTRVGRLLRATHLDEFPQFLNILKGDMSVVGPRPERPAFVEELAKEIPFYRVRHAVKPGMAGWGLVRQGYGASKEEAMLKLQYDLYYIKHQSAWLDMVILLKTLIHTVTFQGR